MIVNNLNVGKRIRRIQSLLEHDYRYHNSKRFRYRHLFIVEALQIIGRRNLTVESDFVKHIYPGGFEEGRYFLRFNRF